MAFEKLVTDHGNFAEVARKAQNTANEIRSRMFGKISPPERIQVIRENVVKLIAYADALERIWETQKAIDEGTYEPNAGGYIRLTKEFYDENISKPSGNGEGSGTGALGNGYSLPIEDGAGSGRSERSKVSDN